MALLVFLPFLFIENRSDNVYVSEFLSKFFMFVCPNCLKKKIGRNRSMHDLNIISSYPMVLFVSLEYMEPLILIQNNGPKDECSKTALRTIATDSL